MTEMKGILEFWPQVEMEQLILVITWERVVVVAEAIMEAVAVAAIAGVLAHSAEVEAEAAQAFFLLDLSAPQEMYLVLVQSPFLRLVDWRCRSQQPNHSYAWEIPAF
jgi:hypothetical protein